MCKTWGRIRLWIGIVLYFYPDPDLIGIKMEIRIQIWIVIKLVN
jgi:hypothetical protein